MKNENVGQWSKDDVWIENEERQSNISYRRGIIYTNSDEVVIEVVDSRSCGIHTMGFSKEKFKEFIRLFEKVENGLQKDVG